MYLSIEDNYIVLLHVLDPKTRIEMRCKIQDFSEEHEIAIRVKEYFGMEILDEIFGQLRMNE